MRVGEIEQWRTVMQGLLDGKTIQYRACDSHPWKDMAGSDDIILLNEPENYRVKPDFGLLDDNLWLLNLVVREKRERDTVFVITALKQKGQELKVLLGDSALVSKHQLFAHYEYQKNSGTVCAAWVPFNTTP